MKEKLFYVSIGFIVCLMMVLAFGFGRFTPMPAVHAQMSGSGAGSTTVVLGETTGRGLLPIVIVDSADDSLLIYEADISRPTWRLELKNARHFRYDKQLLEFPPEGSGQPSPPTDRIRDLLGRQGR